MDPIKISVETELQRTSSETPPPKQSLVFIISFIFTFSYLLTIQYIDKRPYFLLKCISLTLPIPISTDSKNGRTGGSQPNLLS